MRGVRHALGHAVAERPGQCAWRYVCILAAQEDAVIADAMRWAWLAARRESQSRNQRVTQPLLFATSKSSNGLVVGQARVTDAIARQPSQTDEDADGKDADGSETAYARSTIGVRPRLGLADRDRACYWSRPALSGRRRLWLDRGLSERRTAASPWRICWCR